MKKLLITFSLMSILGIGSISAQNNTLNTSLPKYSFEVKKISLSKLNNNVYKQQVKSKLTNKVTEDKLFSNVSANQLSDKEMREVEGEGIAFGLAFSGFTGYVSYHAAKAAGRLTGHNEDESEVMGDVAATIGSTLGLITGSLMPTP